MRLRVVPSLGLSALVLVGLSACNQSTGSTTRAATDSCIPAKAAYRCDSGGTLNIERSGSGVAVVAPDGEAVLLPASPAGQNMRYGEPPYALVLESNEALYMKGGAEPVTCRR